MVAGWRCLLALALRMTRAEILLYLKTIRVPFVGIICTSLAPSLSIHLHLSTAVRVYLYSSTQQQHTAVVAAAPHGGRAGCVLCAVCGVLSILIVFVAWRGAEAIQTRVGRDEASYV